MNGIKYLLDTNFILGILKSNPFVLSDVSARQTRTVKLPDAIIAATALCSRLELLTLDKRLLAITQTPTALPLIP